MLRASFIVRYIPDTPRPNETDEDQYKRLREEYEEKPQVFIDLHLILNAKYPIRKLDDMLEDQNVELKCRKELVKIFQKSLQRKGRN